MKDCFNLKNISESCGVCFGEIWIWVLVFFLVVFCVVYYSVLWFVGSDFYWKDEFLGKWEFVVVWLVVFLIIVRRVLLFCVDYILL